MSYANIMLLCATTFAQDRFTPDQSLERARNFVESVVGSAPSGKSRVDTLMDPQGHESYYVGIGGRYRVTMDVIGGTVRGYSNIGLWDVARKSERTGTRKYSSDTAARAACEAWLKKFVSGKDMRCTKLTQGVDSKDRWGGYSSLGMVNATFTEFAHGYPYVVGIVNYCTIGLDVQTGDLWEMEQYYRAVPESWAVNIDEATAREAAVSFFQKQFGIDPPGFSKVVLGYAVPNGQFGSPNRVSKPPHLARLAYVCWFQDVERKKANVWIDAGNGAVIGGSSLGY